jgi:hypothetical protein
MSSISVNPPREQGTRQTRDNTACSGTILKRMAGIGISPRTEGPLESSGQRLGA